MLCICMYIYIYIERERVMSFLSWPDQNPAFEDQYHQRYWGRPWILGVVRDKDLYTATNKCLQRLVKLSYTVF